MASGFSGGGPDFYGRSMANTGNLNTTGQPNTAPYRGQIPGIFLDQASSQIVNRAAPNLAGKRSLADFQTAPQHNQALAGLHNLYLRSVKPRNYQQRSPISPLSPIDFAQNYYSSNAGNFNQGSNNFCQRFSMPFLQQQQQQRQQQQQQTIQMGMGGSSSSTSSVPNYQHQHQQVDSNSNFPAALSYANPVQQQGGQDSERKMLNKLHELEKVLLDDDEGDAVSVITNTNSEWSIQSLISQSPTNNNNNNSAAVVAPSPTSSSTSSCSSSNSVPSPPSNCSKTTVVEAASAISEGKTDVVAEILARLAQAANPSGNSEQRLLDCMSSALKSRVNSGENPPPVAELFSNEHAAATQLLYDLSPCFKLGFMASNLAIMEAFQDQANNEIHVIDFEVGQGGQYMNLLYELSRQAVKPAMVKITAVADNGGEEMLKSVGEMLSQVADRVGLCLRFKVVTSPRLCDLSRDSLGCEPEEPLAVNLAFKLFRMPDESVSIENPRDELLRRVKGLGPVVVTLVEQEMNTNTATFTGRVNETCSYYGALFESIEATVARDSGERVKVEEGLSRKIGNSVACEGRDRVERCEVFGKWRARMSMAGFEFKPLSQNVAESMRARLSSGNRVNPGFSVKEENGGVCFGWMGRTLTVASAWR